MAPIKVSATVAATPETIWQTCFEPMKWESWDPDLKEMKDVISGSGGCEEGATCIFAMNDGSDFPMALSNVEKNKSVNFYGSMIGGIIKCEGKVLITPVDASTSKIDYTFALWGIVGSIVAILKKKDVVGGTQGGLDNMVKLSEEAEKK